MVSSSILRDFQADGEAHTLFGLLALLLQGCADPSTAGPTVLRDASAAPAEQPSPHDDSSRVDAADVSSSRSDATTPGVDDTSDKLPPNDIDTGSPRPQVVDLVALTNGENALAYDVAWKTTAPARTVLEVACGDDYLESFVSVTPRLLHTVFVMGLYPHASCEIRARASVSDPPVVIEVTVGEPHVTLPALSVRSDGALPQTGWTLLNVFKTGTNPGWAVVVVDELGRYRWYHQGSSNVRSTAVDVRRVPEGVLIGGSWNSDPMIVGWDGTRVWDPGFAMHHHIEPSDVPGQFHYLALSAEGCPTADPSDVVVLYDRPTNAVLDEWRLCEHFVPPAYGRDWSHGNAIAMYPDRSSYVLSTRNLSSLFRIDLATGEIRWQLGLGGDFVQPQETWFRQQHAPEVQPNGNILLFDNGTDQRPWSRGIELALDESTMSVSLAWEYRPSPDVYARAWGDADRQPNGNTLLTFGRTDGSDLIEVTSSGVEAWHLELESPWGVYRAERFVAPRGYVIED